MITPERTKEISLAIKLHFTSTSYNFVQYNGKTRSGSLKSQDSWYIGLSKRLMSEENTTQFFLANTIDGYRKTNKIPTYMRNFNNKEGFFIWKEWKNKVDNIHYLVKEELKNINNTEFSIDNGHPLVYSKFLKNEISFETLSFITLSNPSIMKKWKEQTFDPILFPEFLQVLGKYNILMMNYVKGDSKKSNSKEN
jgi:hypothetical protein